MNAARYVDGVRETPNGDVSPVRQQQQQQQQQREMLLASSLGGRLVWLTWGLTQLPPSSSPCMHAGG